MDTDVGGVTNVVQYAFDPAGNVTNTLISNLEYPISKTYDEAERISAIEAAEVGAFAYSYNTNNGLASRVTYPNGMIQSNVFDVMDRIVGIEYYNTTSLVQSFDYRYNNAGMITQKVIATVNGQQRTNTYSYDSLDRLISESSSLTDQSFTYDLAGNRTTTVVDGVTNAYTLSAGNKLATFGASGTASYNSAGCLTNLTSGTNDLGLSWNRQYMLKEAVLNDETVEWYQCDALGRRSAIMTGSSTNYLVYDGYEVVAETDASGKLLKSYVWAPGIDRMLSYTTYGATTNTYYALTDHLGTIHAFADDSGAIVESYRYDAWGNVLGIYDSSNNPINESLIGNRYTFQGREYSWNTCLYYFRARWYDPITGRWLSKDPIGISGGLNQYKAFGNSPLNFRDFDGLDIYYAAGGGGGGGHSGLIIDDPSSPTGRMSYDFAPKQGGWEDFDVNVLLGPSDTTLSPWHGKTIPDQYIRIPTTPEQDARAIRLAKLAKKEKLSYCVAFNNCAHMARMILDGAGIPLGNKFIDTPEKLLKDILEYLKSQKQDENQSNK